MPDEATTAGPAVERAPEWRAVYINHARGGATNWEIQVVLGVLSDKIGQPHLEEQVTLLMSAEFAKAFVNTLAESVKAYESRPVAQLQSG